MTPADHPVSQYEFDVLIGADGKRNTLEGFKRKEFRGKLAIAITANFINRRTEAEARVQEISGDSLRFTFDRSYINFNFPIKPIIKKNFFLCRSGFHLQSKVFQGFILRYRYRLGKYCLL